MSPSTGLRLPVQKGVESWGASFSPLWHSCQELKEATVNYAVRFFGVLVFSISAVAALAQEDFSADYVDTATEKGQRTTARIYATKDKMRIEPQGPAAQGYAVILNFSNHTTYSLMPEQRMYVEFPQNEGPAGRYTRELYRPSDVENSCTEWLKLPANRGGTCKKVGNETVSGRSTVKFEGTNAKGETGYAWVDRKIGFPIKWQEKNDTWELHNIKEGSQPASLFEVPSGYQKFQMPAGMQNMQRPQ
jgi:hypothetical protein